MIKEIGWKRLIKYFFTELWELIFFLIPYSPVRIWWLRFGGAKISRGCVIERIFFMNLDRIGLAGLTLGSQCYLGPLVILDLAGKITLGDQVSVAARTTILSHHSVGFANHPLLKFYPKQVGHTRLDSGAVLGVNVTVLPGLTIGSNSLVAAGSVVRANLPAKVMAAGVPAEVKKQLK